MRRFVRLMSMLALLAPVVPLLAGPLITERINVNPTTGAQADGPSQSPVLSANGCIVAFVSQSGTLAPAGYGLTTASPAQIYAVDRCATPHTIELISVTNDGTAAADHTCWSPNISADGRYVAFITMSTNLPVPGSAQVNAGAVVYVRDRAMHTTTTPLAAWRPTPQNGGGLYFDPMANLRYMSADASRFAFYFSSAPAVPQNVYVIEVAGGTSTLHPVCAPLDNACLVTSTYMAISSDGGTLLLQSTYPFAPGGNSGQYNVYAYDIATSSSTIVSVTANGTPANQDVQPLSDMALSGDGHLVAFSSATASNFPGNTSDTLQLKDLASGAVTLLSAKSDGTPVTIGYGFAVPQFSDAGDRLVFSSENALIPHGGSPGIDAVVVDRAAGRVASACVSASGSFGVYGCDGTTISGDGKWAAFRSTSRVLVPGDTNEEPDIFVVALDPIVDLIFADGFDP